MAYVWNKKKYIDTTFLICLRWWYVCLQYDICGLMEFIYSLLSCIGDSNERHSNKNANLKV